MNTLVGAVELGVTAYRTAAVAVWLLSALARPAQPFADGWARRHDDARAVVVLLHGVNQSGRVWRQTVRHVMASLPADVDVYAPLLDHAKPTSANVGRVARRVGPGASARTRRRRGLLQRRAVRAAPRARGAYRPRGARCRAGGGRALGRAAAVVVAALEDLRQARGGAAAPPLARARRRRTRAWS